MERKLQERMVGAGVLVLALVILGPMILDGGPERAVDTEAIPGQRSDELHTHTFDLRGPPAAAPEAPPPQPPPAAAPAAGAQGQASPTAGTANPVTPAPAPATTAAAPPPPPAPVESAREVAAAPPAPARPAPAPVAEAPAPARIPAAKPATATPAAARPAAGGAFVVQVGTFGQKDNAERLAATLKGRGFAAVVSASSSGGRTLYRVRVGPAGPRDAATGLAGRLASAGHPGQVVPQ